LFTAVEARTGISMEPQQSVDERLKDVETHVKVDTFFLAHNSSLAI
jgi:hypothetical protein